MILVFLLTQESIFVDLDTRALVVIPLFFQLAKPVPNDMPIYLRRSAHFGTSQYSHLTVLCVVKHHGPSKAYPPGLRHKLPLNSL